MKRAIFITLGIAAALLVTLAVYVEARGGFGGGFGRGFAIDRMAKALNLSDQQVKDIKAITDNALRQSIEVKKDLELKRLDLKNLMEADQPDRAKIAQKIDEIARIRAEMAKIHVMSRLDIRALLTPEQRDKFGELMMKRMEMRRGGQGRFGRFHQGDPGAEPRFQGGEDLPAPPEPEESN